MARKVDVAMTGRGGDIKYSNAQTCQVTLIISAVFQAHPLLDFNLQHFLVLQNLSNTDCPRW